MVAFLVVSTVLAFSVPVSSASAQSDDLSFEYGSAAGLKGVTKVFVYTGFDLASREDILKTIRKTLNTIVVVDRPEDAEVHLVFSADVRRFYTGSWTSSTTRHTGVLNAEVYARPSSATVSGDYSGQSATSTTTTPTYRTVTKGDGVVARLVGLSRIRLLMDFKDSRSRRWERKPRTNSARGFVEAYEVANGEAGNK